MELPTAELVEGFAVIVPVEKPKDVSKPLPSIIIGILLIAFVIGIIFIIMYVQDKENNKKIQKKENSK